ncbi:hypothetical protein ERO13_A11G150650v2 [Gossypium hirsutum]|nr:hypothetical protein ERO13_A11G150650v2 [Gossypium hirsutum]
MGKKKKERNLFFLCKGSSTDPGSGHRPAVAPLYGGQKFPSGGAGGGCGRRHGCCDAEVTLSMGAGWV